MWIKNAFNKYLITFTYIGTFHVCLLSKFAVKSTIKFFGPLYSQQCLKHSFGKILWRNEINEIKQN